jgi:ABC-type dipeptide/oligopeptide/nickel transport system ATPase component
MEVNISSLPKESILEIKNLSAEFDSSDGKFLAVNNVSWSIDSGKTLGIAGESGSGKSVSALSVLGLVPNPPGRIVNGQVNYLGSNLLNSSERELRKIRGNEISMIFQDPMTSLNPVLTIAQPLVRTHPRTKQKLIYVNPGFTSHIIDIPRKESDGILSFLYELAPRPEFQLRHKWDVGTLAVWDNTATQHAAVDDFFPAYRELTRVTFGGHGKPK